MVIQISQNGKLDKDGLSFSSLVYGEQAFSDAAKNGTIFSRN